MAKQTLLKKALLRGDFRKSYSKHSEHELEDLAIAYVTSSIAYKQIATALGATGSAAYGPIASSLRRACQKGRIKIRITKV